MLIILILPGEYYGLTQFFQFGVLRKTGLYTDLLP